MGKPYFLLVLSLFLLACSSPPAPLESNVTWEEEKLEEDIEVVASEPEQASIANHYLKKLEAHGFGLFNFSALTAETCPVFYDDFRFKIQDLKEDIEDAEDDLINEKQDVLDVQEQLDLAEQQGNDKETKDLKEDLNQEYDEFQDVEDAIDEMDDLYKKYVIIQNEISDYCLSLGVKV